MVLTSFFFLRNAFCLDPFLRIGTAFTLRYIVLKRFCSIYSNAPACLPITLLCYAMWVVVQCCSRDDGLGLGLVPACLLHYCAMLCGLLFNVAVETMEDGVFIHGHPAALLSLRHVCSTTERLHCKRSIGLHKHPSRRAANSVR